jgi:hypothetical protein
MEKTNRQFKDSVFTDLYGKDESAKNNILELYNALFDTNYTDPSIVDIVALEDVLFCNLKNDVAFTVENRRLVLSEHQSTLNANMPLRSLMYIAREYEKIVPIKERYKKRLVQIPTPIFIMFYNGKEDMPAEQVLRLSDAFKEYDEFAGLELTVRVININPSKHHEILGKCKTLREYSQFVDITRNYQGDKHMLRKAISECIHKGILKNYLLKKSSEVINMLFGEYDYATDIAVQREEAAEEATEKAVAMMQLKADKTFIENIEILAKNLNVSIEEACEKLNDTYEHYQEIKKKLETAS